MTDNANKNDASVKFLYGTKFGKLVLEFLLAVKAPAVLGAFLRSPASHFLIARYIKKNGIPMKEFPNQKYKSFNDFFTRKKSITFDSEPSHLISPSDSLLSVYKITEESSFHIKGFDYTLKDFFNTDSFSDTFKNGLCLVFRLCASDYHRYCYIDDGEQSGNHFIEGSLYSVQSAACENFRVYTKNRRSWAILNTKNFGTVAQIEIGAFSVGGIKNHYEASPFKKGEEKGYFDLHGSTIVLLFKENAVKLLPSIIDATKNGREVRVKIGEQIGLKSL